VLWCDLQRGPTRLYHGTQGKERRPPVSSTTSSCSFRSVSLFPLFFSAIGKEVGRWWDIVREVVGCTGAITRFIAPRCNNRGGKVAGLRKHSKRHSKNNLMRHLTPCATCPIHHGNSKVRPHRQVSLSGCRCHPQDPLGELALSSGSRSAKPHREHCTEASGRHLR
jgi:hypothetical protein